MTILDRNMNILKNKAPLLYKTVSEETPLQAINIEKMAGEDNYIIESDEAKCFMHSIYDIENETKMMLQLTENDTDTIILFGIGNGYVLRHIAETYQSVSEIIVVEPSLQIFRTFLENYDINKILKPDANITFIVNKRESFVVDALYFKMIEAKKTSMVFHVSYCSVFSSYYNNMVTELSKLLKVKAGDIRTISAQWQLWLMNSIKNLRVETLPFESVTDIFKGKTAIMVSAGPSLNKNIHLLEKLKEKAIILAVGSAVTILDNKGIVPHFRAAIDGFPNEKKIFGGIDSSVSPLLFTNQLYYEILPEYKGDKLRFILDTEYIGKYIYNKMNFPFQEYISGASVANGTLSFLCKLGCSRIVFMGQDLSYTREGLHARGVGTEKEDRAWIAGQEYIVVENIYGEKVYSIDPYLQMKYAIESAIKPYPGIEFLNATEGGLGIEGAENITAQELLDMRLKEENYIDIGKELKIRLCDEGYKKQYNEKIRQGLSVMKEELIEVANRQEEMLKFLKRLMKLKEKNAGNNVIENELRYLTTLEKEMHEIPVYREVITRALHVDILSINTSFQYKGPDRTKMLESKEKIIVNTMAKVKEYICLAYRLIEDDYSQIIIERE